MRTRNAGTALGDETHARHNSENPAPEAGMSRDVINIGLNMFRAGIRRYSEPEQELLEWLWGYTFDVLGNSKIELERALGYDYKFIYDVLTGAFDGSLETFCAAIINLKAKAAQKMPLVGTIVTMGRVGKWRERRESLPRRGLGTGFATLSASGSSRSIFRAVRSGVSCSKGSVTRSVSSAHPCCVV